MLSMRGWVREGVRIPEEYAECDRIVTCRVRPRKDELQESWIIIARQEVYLTAIADGPPHLPLPPTAGFHSLRPWGGSDMRRETMKTMFLVAAAAFTLGIGSAYAQGSPSASGYVYPDFWEKQTAQTAPQ